MAMSISSSAIRKIVKVSLTATGNEAKDEFSEMLKSNEVYGEAIRNKLEAQERMEAEEAADVVMKLVSGSRKRLEEKIDELRHLRRREKELRESIKRLDTAIRYGLETNNFAPLAQMNSVGTMALAIATEELSGDSLNIFQIPEDWKPSSEASKNT